MKTKAETTLRFLGASGTVTGSRFLLETPGARVLLDCGLFQGGRALRRRNRDPPKLEPAQVDAILLSRAHLDHSGYLPVLVRRGFRGPVYCTPGTRDLLEVLLPDAAKLEKEQAAHLNEHGLSKHHPALPTGGRILHPMRPRLPDERTTVLLAGFPAAGTSGRSLQDGTRLLGTYGRDVKVRARVEIVDGPSPRTRTRARSCAGSRVSCARPARPGWCTENLVRPPPSPRSCTSGWAGRRRLPRTGSGSSWRRES